MSCRVFQCLFIKVSSDPKKKPFRESTFNVNVQKCGLLGTSAGSTPDAIFRAQVTIGLLSGCVVFVVLFFYEVV